MKTNTRTMHLAPGGTVKRTRLAVVGHPTANGVPLTVPPPKTYTHPKNILALPAVFLFLLSSSLAHAATYYVVTTGNDANPGTQAQPFRTIARGIAAAARSE